MANLFVPPDPYAKESRIINATMEKVASKIKINMMNLIGTDAQVEAVTDEAMRQLVVAILVRLYGSQAREPKELPSTTRHETVHEPDPDCPPFMPATWYHHMLMSLVLFVNRHPRLGLRRLGVWYMSRWFRATILSVKTRPRRIVTEVHRCEYKYVCPHVGASHLSLASNPCFAFLAGNPAFAPVEWHAYQAVVAAVGPRMDDLRRLFAYLRDDPYSGYRLATHLVQSDEERQRFADLLEKMVRALAYVVEAK